MRPKLLLLPLGLLSAACTISEPLGRDFPRPEAVPSLAIGRSTEADIIAVYGQPIRRSENAVTLPVLSPPAAGFQPSSDTTLTYQSGTQVVFAYAAPYTTKYRTLAFRLHDGRLAGYDFNSAFVSDAPALDTDAASALLKRPDVTMGDLMTVLGPPWSRQTYPGPSTSQTVGEVDRWQGDARASSSRVVRTQSVLVRFGRDGRLLSSSINAAEPIQ